MPTEHEYKYVVDTSLLTDTPEALLRVKCEKHLVIEQGYLAYSKGHSSRVRSVTENGRTKWFHTMKQKVTSRVVEIEKKLDDRDGGELWECCVGKLKKDRYVFKDHDLTWELDLFKHDGKIYFMLAEVELPEGLPRPKTVPALMQHHILYEVPLTDDRFSNKRLGDLNYARSLYAQMISEVHKE